MRQLDFPSMVRQSFTTNGKSEGHSRLSKYSTLKDRIITSFWMLSLLQTIFIIQYVVQAFNTAKIEELKFGKKAIFRQARVTLPKSVRPEALSKGEWTWAEASC